MLRGTLPRVDCHGSTMRWWLARDYTHQARSTAGLSDQDLPVVSPWQELQLLYVKGLAGVSVQAVKGRNDDYPAP